MSKIYTGFILGWMFILSGICAGTDIFVDNVKGDDKNSGTNTLPFKTLERSVKAMSSGDVLHLVPNEIAYACCDRLTFWNLPAGTQERPTIVDGHGAIISSLTHFAASKWKSEGDNIFSMYLSNNYHDWGNPPNGYWVGFDLVFFDGKPGINCKSRDLLVSNGYFLHTNRTIPAANGDLKTRVKDPLLDMLYIKLPDGKTPATIKVEAPKETGVGLGKDYITIRNLTSKYSAGDGFNGSKCAGIRFENVHGCYNMDQGISHHGSKSTVLNSLFDNNCGAGIVDVYPEAEITYRNCVIENNPFRGGVEFHSGKFTMENCIIRNNEVQQFLVTNDASVNMVNCFLSGTNKREEDGISIMSGSLSVNNCTIFGLKKGIVMSLRGSLKILNSAFIDCETIYRLPNDKKLCAALEFENNYLQPGIIVYLNKVYLPDQLHSFVSVSGLDKNSIIDKYSGARPPLKNEIKDKTGSGIGARLENAKSLLSTGSVNE